VVKVPTKLLVIKNVQSTTNRDTAFYFFMTLSY
jgi:hypothetical protein